MLLGVVGNNGSGKSTFCDYLASKGFMIVSLSDVIREHLKEKKLEPTRDNLTEQANQLKQTNGLTYCAEKTFESVNQAKENKAIFDSIRHPNEVKYLKDKNVVLIAIKTSLEQRYNRIKQRQRQTDFVSYDTFKSQDEREASGASFGQSINQCLALCEHEIVNDSTLESFHSKIDLLLEKLKS